MACALSGNSCTVTSSRLVFNRSRNEPKKRHNLHLFQVRASAEDSDCNTEECAPDKEVGKVSMEWVAVDNTKVVGTFPPRKRGWTGYVEKDTAGQTNIYSVEVFASSRRTVLVVLHISLFELDAALIKESNYKHQIAIVKLSFHLIPKLLADENLFMAKNTGSLYIDVSQWKLEPAVYVAESAISSGNRGSSADGSDNTAAITAGIALISIAAASSVLLQVGKNAPVIQTAEYSGPSLSYYITKFMPPEIAEATVPTSASLQTESSAPEVSQAKVQLEAQQDM